MRRRGFLAAPALLMAGPAWADEWAAIGAAALAPIRAAIDVIPPGPAILRSWDVGPPEVSDFDRVHQVAGFTYDNALAGLALLGAGEVVAAQRIGDALVLAQRDDRSWRDGRLRNAYRAGAVVADAPVPLPGWWAGRWAEDGYQVGTATGNVAWAMLLWGALAARMGATRYGDSLRRAGAWIETIRAPSGYRGGFLGHEPSPTPLAWVSTEHAIDCWAAFRLAGMPGPAGHARRFVDAMWDGARGVFNAGLTPDGAVNRFVALDPHTFALLAFARDRTFGGAETALARFRVEAGWDFDTDRDGAWTEGTAQVAAALRARGREPAALEAARLALAQAGPNGWLRAASVPSLTTGLATGLIPGAADFRYPRRGHLAANAWLALAASGTNPFLP